MAVERNEGNKWVTATSQGGGLDIQKGLEFELLGEGLFQFYNACFYRQIIEAENNWMDEG